MAINNEIDSDITRKLKFYVFNKNKRLVIFYKYYNIRWLKMFKIKYIFWKNKMIKLWFLFFLEGSTVLHLC